MDELRVSTQLIAVLGGSGMAAGRAAQAAR